MDGLCVKAGISWPSISFGGEARIPTAQISALGRTNGVSLENSAAAAPPQKNQSRFSFKYPLRSLWRKGNDGIALDDAVVVEQGEEEIGVDDEEEEEDEEIEEREYDGSWVLKILHVRSLWKEQGKNGVHHVLEEEVKREIEDNVVREEESSCDDDDDDEEEEIEGCSVEEDEENVEFDRDSFSRLLRRVSLPEAKLYARMSFLGNLAYSISKIKQANLLKPHGLRFVTSSFEKKAMPTNTEPEQNSAQVQETENKAEEQKQEDEEQKIRISESAAYHIAASAASYLQSHTSNILSFKSPKAGTADNSVEGDSEIHDNVTITSSELASFVATTDSMTAVVAAKEETKQAVAKELNSACPSPCAWFICDDDQSKTRFFVIQGSESLASWQANLLFEPIQFEGLDVIVHRGIYEAAKGIYEQMLPEVRAHVKAHGNSATFRFTGHSLGGSLSLLVNLMLLIRGEVPLSSLLPVIMFGAPSVMCGGDQLLRRLGLPRSHVQAVTMHRDIVPRAFSCHYPDHVAELLKAVNGNFRNHPCLQNQKMLYAPMGDILILQPEEKISPHHHLLPPGSGLYLLSRPLSDSADPEKQLKAAKTVFFNTPHPLEILSDRNAYGSDGTIFRDHDMNSYLKSVLGVIRVELKQMRRAKRKHRREVWWPHVSTRDGLVVSQQSSHVGTSFSGILHTGRESVKRFSRLVASQHMPLLVVLLFPARLLVFSTFAITQFR